MPGNPWPHDMVLRIDQPGHLLTLLFIRAAWALPTAVELPPLEPVPDAGASAMPDTASRGEWAARWEMAWQRAWAWYDLDGVGQRHPTPETLRSLGPGSPLIAEFPPMWEIEHGDAGIDRAAFAAWSMSQHDDHHKPLEEHPERRNLDELIPAWRSGIESIIVLPYAGYFARRVNRRHLAVCKTTRDDPDLYARALREST
ncbi:MAG: hypothetical protein J0G30_00110 [Actinomycetales bacterium]|nr:hypothetical protein [Actinomycetales bacterium]